jgi:uncharacterized membrane protein YozB (DUF420 family)
MLTGPNVILALRVAVAAVTVLLLASLGALARGNYRLHGRINLAFFVLTVTALLSLELVTRVVAPNLFADYFASYPERRRLLDVHLSFSVPAALLMPFMLFTGLTHRRAWHIALAVPFCVLWVGTFVTGLFFL